MLFVMVSLELANTSDIRSLPAKSKNLFTSLKPVWVSRVNLAQFGYCGFDFKCELNGSVGRPQKGATLLSACGYAIENPPYIKVIHQLKDSNVGGIIDCVTTGGE